MLVTAQRRSGDLASALVRRGAQVHIASTLGIESHIDEETLIKRTEELIADRPHIVVVTTAIGFRSWLETAEAAGLQDELFDVLDHSRIVARGPKARGAIQAAGLFADWVAESETSREIAEYLVAEGVDGLRVAVQHHGAGDDGLESALGDAGAATVRLIVYRWGSPPDEQAVVQSVLDSADGGFDCVIFTSAPGASAWLEAVRRNDVFDRVLHLAKTGRMVIAAVGPVTAEPLVVAGFEPLIPERGRLGAMVRSIVMHFGAEDRGIPVVAGMLHVNATCATIDQQIQPVSPSGLSILRLLAMDPGAVVPRQAVLNVLPGGSDDEHVVDVAVARLRQNLGGRPVIRTVVKRGYRLDVVEPEEQP